MKEILYARQKWVVYSKEEADALHVCYVPWRQIFLVRNAGVVLFVLGDDGIVQPVVHLFRRTILVTPYMTVSRTSKSDRLLAVKRLDGRLGGRGYDPPGPGPLTHKHLAFCAAYVKLGFDENRAFSALWNRRKGRPTERRRMVQALIEDPKIQRQIVSNLASAMDDNGVTDAFLMGELKKQISEGPPDIKSKMLVTALKMKGHIVEVPRLSFGIPMGGMPTPGSQELSGVPFTVVDTPVKKELPVNVPAADQGGNAPANGA